MKPPRSIDCIHWTYRIAAGLAGLLLAACVTAPLPQGDAASDLTLKAIQHIQKLYLRPQEIDRRMMVGALDGLERRFDAVRFEEEATGGRLWVGAEHAWVPLEDRIDAEQFRSMLGQALFFVQQHLDPTRLRDLQESLEEIALHGALHALDPYTTIFSGRGSEDFKIRFSGKLKGIGSRIGRRDGHLIAIKVFSGSPAEKAGLQDADIIVSIDGDPTKPLSVSEAVGRIRGEAGTSVALGIEREKQELEVKIVRGEVRIPTVEARLLGDGIGYARIESMSRATVSEFREKVQGLGKLEGLVLDLRGNTGGSMQTAIRLADLFMAGRMILRIVNKEGAKSRSDRRESRAHREVLFRLPIVILVNSMTASSAEILSGALAPLRRVTLVGQTTFGKGVIQRVLPLSRKTLLKVTVAQYVLSEDRKIHGKGINPDVVLRPVSSTHLAGLANVAPSAIPYVRETNKKDEFPIEVAQVLLSGAPRLEALKAVRERADASTQQHLEEMHIPWRPHPRLPDPLPEPLRIKSARATLEAGSTGRMQIQVTNPNDFTIPDVWVSLDAPVDYFANKLVALGDLPAGGTASGELLLTPPEGIAVPDQPITVHCASGSQPLQSETLTFHVIPHAPRVDVRVTRIASGKLVVTLHNPARYATGAIRIDVPGATRTLEDLQPGAREQRELPLSGKTKTVSISFLGPWVRSQIDVPLPETSVNVVPPEVRLLRGGFLNASRVRIQASSAEGLNGGWLFLDGQKQIYRTWDGSSTGHLQTSLEEEGPHDLVAHVESASGVSVTESWHLTVN